MDESISIFEGDDEYKGARCAKCGCPLSICDGTDKEKCQWMQDAMRFELDEMSENERLERLGKLRGYAPLFKY